MPQLFVRSVDLLADVVFPRCRRLAAACLACFESARWDAAERGSRCKAASVARDLLADGFEPLCPFSKSRSAFFRVAGVVVPGFGGASLTPARRALESPMAIACFVERAPCLPSRMWSISSRTNSPACVDGALPSRASFRARSSVSLSGMIFSLALDGAINLPGWAVTSMKPFSAGCILLASSV